MPTPDPISAASGPDDVGKTAVSGVALAKPVRSRVSIVIPIYNEAETLRELFTRLDAVSRGLSAKYDFEFVFVDDGSGDATLAAAEQLAALDARVQAIALRRNYGQTAALQVGFEHASGAIIVSMDGDLQHFPEDIPALLEQIEAGYEVVCGWRHERREGIVRRWPSAVANWLIRAVTGITIHDIGTTFRACHGDVVRQLRLLGEHHRFIPVIAASLGARITEVKIQNIERPSGTSNYGLSRTFNVLLDIFFVVFYVRYLDRPMRVFGRLALAVIGAAVAITIALAYLFLVYHVPVVRDRAGWFILALVLYVSGIQFLLFGLMSEVVVRMYFYPGEAKPYLVRRVIGRGARPPR
jgi:glycosyltransferase involved in cell wall biosynthesis